MSFRVNYAKGVETYYRNNAATYSNPHEPRLRDALEFWRPHVDPTRTLDVGAGDGLVSRKVLEWGGQPFALDAFTEVAFRARCPNVPFHAMPFEAVVYQEFHLGWTFRDLWAPLPGETRPRPFTLSVASYALHLCVADRLIWVLRAIPGPQLLVLSPHKRPVFPASARKYWVLEQEATTARVRGRLYRRVDYDPDAYYDLAPAPHL